MQTLDRKHGTEPQTLLQLCTEYVTENAGKFQSFEAAIHLIHPDGTWLSHKNSIQHLHLMQRIGIASQVIVQPQDQIQAFGNIVEDFEVEQLLLKLTFFQSPPLYFLHEISLGQHHKIGI